MMTTAAFSPDAAAQTPSTNAPDAPTPVLDIENRRVVMSERAPRDATPVCDVLIIGGGTGGVAAAISAGLRGMTVILVEPTSLIGGQFTSQLVPVPDENSHIEKQPGPSTHRYRAIRENVRRVYRNMPGIVPGREQNVGQCWVSRISGLPGVWEDALGSELNQLQALGRLRRVYKRHQLRSVTLAADGRVNYADIVDLDTGGVTRIGAKFLLDATEDGSALAAAGLPTVIGQEAKSAYNEPHAPDTAHPEWVQSFTYCFLTQWQTGGARKIVEKPAEYEYFKSLGEYTLDYVYSERGTVRYKMLEKAPGSGGPFWTYRRLVTSSSFKGGPKPPEGDIALINWRGNDFHEETYLGKPLEEQVRVLERGRAFAQGFLYWLQTECPRDDGKGVGYPEIQQVSHAMVPGLAPDGFALHPYVRESQRLKAKFTLTENHLTAPPGTTDAKWGEEFFDSVGCALYSVDIHPTKGEPPLLVPALPYHIPLGSFLTESGAPNVLPSGKNIGASRLALASARMHPTEWLTGEIAGSLAAFCIRNNIDDPAMVRDDPARLKEFRDSLREAGILLQWREILAP